jgi:hypothetical protein
MFLYLFVFNGVNKMKKMIGILAASVLAQLAYAQATSSVPYQITFENYGAGSSILSNANNDGWFGTEGTVAVVTNIQYTPAMQSYLTNSVSHSNVLKFSDGTISNMFDGNGLPDIAIDTMIQPVRSEAPTSQTMLAVSNSQVSLYFDTNGYINVYHGIMSSPGWEIAPDIRQWTQLTGFGPLETGNWVRLTIVMKHMTGDEKQSFFQIKANGSVLSNAAAYASAEHPDSEYYPTNGSWFLCANYNQNKLNQIAINGSGMLDDFVVATTEGSYVAAAPTVYVMIAGNGGSVTPPGPVVFTASPGETNFVILASNYYQISSVYTGAYQGVSNLVATEEGAVSNSFVWANITGNSSLFVTFAPMLAASNVPLYWMADRSPTNGDYPTWDSVSLSDVDGDGMVTWKEYIARTHPGNSNSVLRILSQTFSNGLPRIVWSGSTEPDRPASMIQLSTNLVDINSWNVISNNIPADASGTNEWKASAPAPTPAFYRVSVTN